MGQQLTKAEQEERLLEALLAAFPDVGSLRRMVRFGLGQNLDAIANIGKLSDAVFDLISWADSRDKISALVIAARNSNPDNTKLRRVAEELKLAPSSGELESIVIRSVGFNDVEAWRAKMSKCELAVCRIETPRGLGTGFLINPDIVVTNHHVIKHAIAGEFDSKDVVLRFDYKMDENGTTVQRGQEYRLAVDWLIASSPDDELDYALLHVEGNPGNSHVAGQTDAPERGWLTPKAHAFTKGEPLLIIQHPEAKPLAISAGSFLSYKSSQQRIVHSVSTLPGSSGSPCFTSDWELVALHSAGSASGNEATPFSAILDKVGVNRLDPSDELVEPETEIRREALMRAEQSRVEPSYTGADPKNPPYVGPEPFSEDRSDDFFGRSTEVKLLVQLLSHPQKRVVLLYSPSGAGKTSLINAGLRPAVMEMGGYNFLPTARLRVPAGPIVPGQNPYTFAAIASMDPEAGLVEYEEPITWAQYLAVEKNPKLHTVLVIDQLEEILTSDLSKSRQIKKKREFFVEIRDALTQNPQLHVLLAFRQEYLAELQGLAGELYEFWNPYQLTMLRRKDAKEAIRRPAKRQGVEFHPDEVLEQLVNRLCDDEEFVEPLQLQLICQTLWKSLDFRQTKISWQDLQLAIREKSAEDDLVQLAKRDTQSVSRFVDYIIYNFCDQAVRDASASSRVEAGHVFPTKLIDLVCRQFVSERGARVQVRQDKDWTGDLPNPVAEELARQRFLRIVHFRDELLYELAHDTLTQPVVDRADGVDDDTLWSIFSSAVHEVTATAPARPQELTEADIEQECCLTFVAEDGGRLKVSHESLETAARRLPLWVIEGLVERRILRKTFHHEQEWYEIIHWRMALAIHQKRFRAMGRLYRTRKGLAAFLEEYLVSGARPTVWYQKSDEIQRVLGNVEEVIGSANLTEIEANFVLRASLANSYHAKDFTIEIGRSLPQVTAEILREAIWYEDNSEVRRNAAFALGFFPLDERDTILIELALEDPDETVRKAATGALARFDSSSAWGRLFARLRDPVKRRSALTVLAWMQDMLPNAYMHQFEERRKQLSRMQRVRLRSRLTSVRWQSAKLHILLAWAVAMFSTLLITVPPRAFLSTLNLTTTQIANMGIRATLDGVLNGIIGVMPWILFIGGGLLIWWHVVEDRRPWQGRFSPLVGAICGLVGGIVNTGVLLQAYSKPTLSGINWIPNSGSNLIEAITGTGAAFIMPVYGMVVGLGVGEIARRMLTWWNDETGRKRASGDSVIQLPIREIPLKVLSKSWRILLPMFVCAAFILHAVFMLMPDPFDSFGKLLGESLSIFFGGVGLVLGLFLGLHTSRKGLHISGYEEQP